MFLPFKTIFEGARDANVQGALNSRELILKANVEGARNARLSLF